MFYIRIRHGGTFRRYPGRTHVDGHVDIFDLVDIDLFTVVVLNMMVVQLGYTSESKPLYYNYLRPLTSLDEGLYALACEEDVRCLATLVRSFKFIEVYIEHGVYWLAVIEHRSEEMLLLTWHDSSEPTKEPVCDSVTPRQLSFEKTELDGEAGFSDIVGSGLESYGLSHDESFGVDDLDLNLNEHVDLNVSQTETQYELPVFEVPVSKEPDVDTYDDDEDDDFLVDEENEIVEPDVDVHLFGISMDVPFDNIGITNLVSDDVLEVEDVDVINTGGFDNDLVMTMKQVITGGEGVQPSDATRTAPAAPVTQNRQTLNASTTNAESAPTPTNSSSQALTITTLHRTWRATTTCSATSSIESSSQYVDPSNMHTFYQPYQHEYQWTKDHPLEQVIRVPSRPILIRNQLRTDAEMCIYAFSASIMEPRNVKEAMTNPRWIESMQDELIQFKRLDVWESFRCRPLKNLRDGCGKKGDPFKLIKGTALL
ncbi:hypothetical protein Tco_0340128 [Tanacetum coccineum]